MTENDDLPMTGDALRFLNDVRLTIKRIEEEKDHPTKARAAISIGWADAPWLTEDAKQQVRDSTPPYLRDTVEFGTFSIGDGSIYPIPVEEITVPIKDTFKIPPHWRHIYGMDVGWNRTAVAFLAQNPDTGVWYMYDEHYQGNQPPEVHAARVKSIAGDWMTGAIDPASHNRSQIDGKQLIVAYRKLGLKLREADNTVESGITSVWSLLASGRLKIFANCYNLLNEYILYRRDKGKVVKENDHLLDALRYGIVEQRYALPKPQGGQVIPGISGPLIQVKRRYDY